MTNKKNGRMTEYRKKERKKDEKKEGLCKRRERGNLNEESDLQVRRKQKAGGEGVVSCAVPVGNVSWMLFQEGRSSNFS